LSYKASINNRLNGRDCLPEILDDISDTNRSYLKISMVLLSVIIPVYNDAKGLQRTLNSLMQQTIPFANFEVHVINDGNDAETVTLAKKYANGPLRINFIHRYPNKGAYFSRNEAIEYAVGGSIAFVDADSVAAPTWLETGLRYLNDYDYVAGNVQIDLKTVHSISTYYDYLTAFPIEAYFNKFGFGVTGNLFLKKAVFAQSGLFKSELYSGGDMEFGVRLNKLPGIRKCFAKDCVVFHPARNHMEQIKKIRRVTRGQKELLKQMPDTFSFLKKNDDTTAKRIITAFFNDI